MDENILHKVCFKCGRDLPLSSYYKHPQMSDGHLNKCKECTKKDVHNKYEENVQDPSYIAKERARGRNKYIRYCCIWCNGGERKITDDILTPPALSFPWFPIGYGRAWVKFRPTTSFFAKKISFVSGGGAFFLGGADATCVFQC